MPRHPTLIYTRLHKFLHMGVINTVYMCFVFVCQEWEEEAVVGGSNEISTEWQSTVNFAAISHNKYIKCSLLVFRYSTQTVTKRMKKKGAELSEISIIVEINEDDNRDTARNYQKWWSRRASDVSVREGHVADINVGRTANSEPRSEDCDCDPTVRTLKPRQNCDPGLRKVFKPRCV